MHTPSESTRWPKGFWNLMFTQFQGAFSDNALRWLVIFLFFAMTPGKEARDDFASHAATLFAIPFLVFSTVGGWLADRHSKRTVMISVKIAEVGIMLFAAWALMAGSRPLQLSAICLMGLHSTIFAPAKYGVMPEILPTAKLSAGNGILELLTFIGIILGTFAGGFLAEKLADREGLSGLLLAAVAVVGAFAARGIARVPAADPVKKFNWNILGEIFSQLRAMRPDVDLWRANWGNAAFFFVATLIQVNLALYAQDIFHLTPTGQAWLQAALSLGIGLGSMLAGKLSHDRIEYGLVPIGAFFMALAALALGWPSIPQPAFAAALGVLGMGGGFFIVPIVSVLQHRPAPEIKGAVQASASWLSWVGIAAAATLQGFLAARMSYGMIFWFCSAVAAIAGLYVVRSRPRALADFFARIRSSD